MPAPPAAETIDSRLLAARTRLLLDHPFLGALALRLPLQAADPSWNIAGMHTDARTLFYDPAYVARLDLEQLQFALCAQALHCALLHFDRRGRREPGRWQQACAHTVALILVEEGLTPPPGTPVESRYQGMTAEEIYAQLPEPAAGTGQNRPRQAAGGRSGRPPAPPPPGSAARQALAEQWKQRLTSIAQQALAADRLGEGMARVFRSVLRPVLPWRAILARHFNGIAREDFSYARPSSRRGDPAIFPGLRSSQLDVVVAVDVSGSIDAGEFNAFMTEVNALKAQVRVRLTLLTCDAKITGDSPWVFEAWEPVELPQTFVGSGATDFRPVFDWVAAQQLRPDLLVYFTDAAGRFPERAADYPTLWLVKGPRPVPWGERIQLN